MRAGLISAVLLLAACASAPTPSPTPTPTPTEPVRILADGLYMTVGEQRSVAAATTADEYDALWQRLAADSSPAGDPPPVDMEREMVFYLGMAGSSSCPEEFQRLVVDELEALVYAEWQVASTGNACTDDLQSQGLLLAVSRDELPTGPFTLSLRVEPVCRVCPDDVLVQPDS